MKNDNLPMRNPNLEKISMGKWKIIELEKVMIGKTFRFEQQSCVRCGPFSYIDNCAHYRATRDLPEELKTLVAAKIEDIHFEH